MRTFKYAVVILATLIVISVVAWLTVFLLSSRTPDTTPNIANITTRQVASGFTQPTDIVSTPGDGHLYIVEQTGTVQRIIPDQSDRQVFMDISDKVVADGEMGLLGLAFHPNYSENRFVFVNYIDTSENTVIARFQVTDGVVNPASEKIILQVDQPYSNHNGGDLAFGADGYLYASLGDGGSAGDPGNNAQNLGNLLGKILRIDINSQQAYNIPSDNPFVGREGARAEIWSYGLRNPWRISFDSQTHDLFIADVGQSELEEVDFQPASSKGGENYGWRCFEGSKEYSPDGCQNAAAYTPPIIEYDHSNDRCSITGGYVYRGEAQPTLQGKYFYADFCGGQLYYAEKTGDTWQQTLALASSMAISSFGVDNSSELYLADYDNGGSIYKIETTTP